MKSVWEFSAARAVRGLVRLWLRRFVDRATGPELQEVQDMSNIATRGQYISGDLALSRN